jgi:type IV pilus assembly protein PilM
MESMYETNYEPQGAGEVIGLIHIGARYTSINVLSNGISIFTGDLPVGGEEFTDSLRRAMRISAEEAETFKVTGLLNGKKASELEPLLRPAADSLAEDIQRTLSLYGAIASEEGIRNIYLSGGGAKVVGLAAAIKERLGVPVQLAEPFRNFRLGKNTDKTSVDEIGPLLGIAVGLAIRRPGDK